MIKMGKGTWNVKGGSILAESLTNFLTYPVTEGGTRGPVKVYSPIAHTYSNAGEDSGVFLKHPQFIDQEPSSLPKGWSRRSYEGKASFFRSFPGSLNSELTAGFLRELDKKGIPLPDFPGLGLSKVNFARRVSALSEHATESVDDRAGFYEVLEQSRSGGMESYFPFNLNEGIISQTTRDLLHLSQQFKFASGRLTYRGTVDFNEGRTRIEGVEIDIGPVPCISEEAFRGFPFRWENADLDYDGEDRFRVCSLKFFNRGPISPPHGAFKAVAENGSLKISYDVEDGATYVPEEEAVCRGVALKTLEKAARWFVSREDDERVIGGPERIEIGGTGSSLSYHGRGSISRFIPHRDPERLGGIIDGPGGDPMGGYASDDDIPIGDDSVDPQDIDPE